MSHITLDEFVSREIIYCVSSLVSTLTEAASETGKVGDISQDELMGLCQRDDWETPVEWHIQHDMDRDELVAAIVQYDPDQNEEATLEWCDGKEDSQLQYHLLRDLETGDNVREFADDNRIDPETIEVYEHWIVSDYLARKLTDHGEAVGRDIAGLTIWGRCTTGQAISMDEVIQQIYNEMTGK